MLPAGFFARDTERVARDLLGCILESRVRNAVTSGRIVEVEAYVGPHDPAGHGYQGRRTRRNDRLFGPPGIAYVYFTYGMHWCVNAVTEREGYPAAVLIRALEPLTGLDSMRCRRGRTNARDLCSGPAKLCQALGITGALNGMPLRGGRLRIRAGARVEKAHIVHGPRIGITRAVDWPLRFYLRDSEWVSR
ncbi:MAG: DNA-3-methyladenine glycosylase [Gemmatimonadetes bacterium]|nr:DNA-3-methyladenine glycosylase [Gemmatimonadota bacterium]